MKDIKPMTGDEIEALAASRRKPTNITVYKAAIEHFGIPNQLDKALEEMHELSIEIFDYKAKRGKQDELFVRICKEMADVEIMLEQLKLIFDNDMHVKRYKKEKVQRLKNRIELDITDGFGNTIN